MRRAVGTGRRAGAGRKGDVTRGKAEGGHDAAGLGAGHGRGGWGTAKERARGRTVGDTNVGDAFGGDTVAHVFGATCARRGAATLSKALSRGRVCIGRREQSNDTREKGTGGARGACFISHGAHATAPEG
ncbi:hypothetical protein ERJ75_000190200 [Trypanosoma vivax]|nr:hypothetical protein ERJ75_000190200 [Trypanosoma vivax]